MMKKPEHVQDETCEAEWAQCSVFQRGFELLGRRWTAVIIYMLFKKPHRFNELLNAIQGISDRLLTERLRELEENGLVERRVLPESPIGVEYALTEAGFDAQQIVDATFEWANRWFKSDSET